MGCTIRVCFYLATNMLYPMGISKTLIMKHARSAYESSEPKHRYEQQCSQNNRLENNAH